VVIQEVRCRQIGGAGVPRFDDSVTDVVMCGELDGRTIRRTPQGDNISSDSANNLNMNTENKGRDNSSAHLNAEHVSKPDSVPDENRANRLHTPAAAPLPHPSRPPLEWYIWYGWG
jgi:hypothetical protein